MSTSVWRIAAFILGLVGITSFLDSALVVLGFHTSTHLLNRGRFSTAYDRYYMLLALSALLIVAALGLWKQNKNAPILALGALLLLLSVRFLVPLS
jgi:hypothetical protein